MKPVFQRCSFCPDILSLLLLPAFCYLYFFSLAGKLIKHFLHLNMASINIIRIISIANAIKSKSKLRCYVLEI